MTFEIDISNRQQLQPVDRQMIQNAILTTLRIERVASAVLSITIVDNAAIHAVNRDHLQHDYPTDVISFQLSFERDEDETGGSSLLRAEGAAIEGEIVASAEMAADRAAEGGWTIQDELVLYVIHGLLHVCGYDDLSPEDQAIMRSREREILGALGRKAIYAED